MNFARALFRDLVDKRLWPVALLLVVALIGVPVLLSRGGGEGAALPAAAVDPQTSADEARPAVELAGPASVRSRPGKMRDPFRRASAEAAQVAASTTTTPASESATTGTSATTDKTAKADTSVTTDDSAKTDTSATTDVGDPAATPAKTAFAYRTEVRFGSVDGDGGTANRISRLTPLGGLDEPALVYLGVSADGKRATFVLGTAARHDGGAVCVDRGCRMISLKAGTSTVVDLAPSDGDPRQYLLQVVSVRRQDMASEGAARSARAYEHPEGRGVLRDVILDGRAAQAIGRITYVQSLGVLAAKTAP